MDIHNYKRRLERTTERINESKDISETNKKIILRLKDYCLYNNISLGKIDSYLFYATKFSTMLNMPIEEAKKEDIQRVIAQLNQTDFSEQTKVSFKVMVKNKMKNDLLKIEIIAKEKGIYLVKYKQGQKELLTMLAQQIGITLDELISRKIAEETGEKICSSPFYVSMSRN